MPADAVASQPLIDFVSSTPSSPQAVEAKMAAASAKSGSSPTKLVSSYGAIFRGPWMLC